MTIKAFTCLSGPAAPLMRANIDTDVIIRIEPMSRLPKNELGPYALEGLRYLPDGNEDPAFILNQPAFRSAPILLTRENFGCGSSREHAVWALQEIGVRCVISPSFGDIFYTNCFQNGVLAIRLPLEDIEVIASQCSDGEALLVDLRTCTIRLPDTSSMSFAIDDLRRDMLLSGLDQIEFTLRNDELIGSWQAADQVNRPWAWLTLIKRP